MLLAYTALGTNSENDLQLCFIPKNYETGGIPIRVDFIHETDSAVYYVGPQEGLVVEDRPSERAKIVTPIMPTKLFLTPDSPDRPGFLVRQLKIFFDSDHHYRIFYIRDLGQEWQAVARALFAARINSEPVLKDHNAG